MKVAAVQYRPIDQDWQGSLDGLVALAERAAPGVDLLVLPELGVVGYGHGSREDILRVSEPAGGATTEALSDVAGRHGCWVVAGFPERDGDLLYNSALIVDRDGRLRGTYRKVFLYEADRLWAEPGQGPYPVFDTGAGSFTVGICMDLNDDRFIRHVATSAPRVVAFPTNWIDEGEPVWGYWARRLQGTGAAMVAANGYGQHGPRRLRGQSAILDGMTLLASAEAEGDQVLVANLSPATPGGGSAGRTPGTR